jgi:hypothetical protein
MQQVKISDVEQFINTESFNSEYYSWDKSDCSLVGILRILLIQEIRKARQDQHEYRWSELLEALEKYEE